MRYTCGGLLYCLVPAVTCLLLVYLVPESDAKPGICPRPPGLRKMVCRKVGPHKCTTDINCPGTQKCCGCPRVCAKPRTIISGIVKPGRCPVFRQKNKPRRCRTLITTDRCTHDQDCPLHQKCCQANICGGKRCTKKIKRARGKKRFRLLSSL